MNETELIELACKGGEQAYIPYSGFRVGAALLTRLGTVYLGCNIENAFYGPTNCAERAVFFKAVSEGKRGFEAITIVGDPGEDRTGEICAPCGVYRQVMMEFCDPKTFRIILENGGGKVRTPLLEKLLPSGSGSDNLKEAVPADSRKWRPLYLKHHRKAHDQEMWKRVRGSDMQLAKPILKHALVRREAACKVILEKKDYSTIYRLEKAMWAAM